MKKASQKLVAKLVLFHVAIIALANYTVQFTDSFLGYTFTWAMFIFPVVILASDLTVRLSDQFNARLIVGLAYFPAILISAWLADWRIGVASGTAYLVGQLIDIWIFQGVRERAKAWWAAPMISTFFANIIDTYVFYSAAFYRSADTFMASNWVEVATVDLGFKIVVSILLFLPLYGVVLNLVQKRVSPA
ncbi:MAG: queuosine precursor transporter [bacterium]